MNGRIQKVLDFLEANGIEYELFTHPPLPTIEIALDYWKNIKATHCKNLFFRNHKGNRHYLVSFECHKNLDIHSLEHLLGQGKLSFASPERMEHCLGLLPGSVSPFGLIHDMNLVPALGNGETLSQNSSDGMGNSADPKELFDNGHRVKFFFDEELLNAVKISFHPCDNTASVVISKNDFLRFLELWGGEYETLRITAPSLSN